MAPMGRHGAPLRERPRCGQSPPSALAGRFERLGRESRSPAQGRSREALVRRGEIAVRRARRNPAAIARTRLIENARTAKFCASSTMRKRSAATLIRGEGCLQSARPSTAQAWQRSEVRPGFPRSEAQRGGCAGERRCLGTKLFGKRQSSPGSPKSRARRPLRAASRSAGATSIGCGSSQATHLAFARQTTWRASPLSVRRSFLP